MLLPAARRALFLLAPVFFFCAFKCPAEPQAFQQGVKLYQAGDYRAAARKFSSTVDAEPENTDAMYYFALCQHRMGDARTARIVYKKIMTEFPGSRAAKMAKAALDQLNASSTAELTTLPKETWVPFRPRGQSLMVQAQVNHNNIEMIFDTGATECLFTREHIKALGLTPPTGEPDTHALGVGSSKGIPVWQMKIDIKVGRIERKGLSVLVSQQSLLAPLLGQSFYRDFEYTIDSAQQSILFKRRDQSIATAAAPSSNPLVPRATVDASGRYVYAVPCVIDGESVIVKTQVNGRELSMILDTGAEVVLFTNTQLKAIGVKALRDPQPLQVNGIAGVTSGVYGVIDRIQLGPIDRRDLRVGATDNAAMSKPLLGQSFFEGWQYTIDRHARLVKISRR